ncbi:hypothetical protein GCM10018952_72370 [Streptosporangium vulgare]
MPPYRESRYGGIAVWRFARRDAREAVHGTAGEKAQWKKARRKKVRRKAARKRAATGPSYKGPRSRIVHRCGPSPRGVTRTGLSTNPRPAPLSPAGRLRAPRGRQ